MKHEFFESQQVKEDKAELLPVTTEDATFPFSLDIYKEVWKKRPTHEPARAVRQYMAVMTVYDDKFVLTSMYLSTLLMKIAIHLHHCIIKMEEG